LLTVTGDVTSSNLCFPAQPDGGNPKGSQEAGLSRQVVIGIVASIAGVVTLLSILIAVCSFLQRRQGGRVDRVGQKMEIEAGPDLNEEGISPPLDPQFAQELSGNVINKQTPYPMEKYTSTPTSPYFVQSIPNNYALDRCQQMQSLNAATADLDQILNAFVFTPSCGAKAWSSTMSPSTPNSRGVQTSEPPIETREQPKAMIPISPLSFMSGFGDSIPASYVRAGITEAESGTGGGRDRAAARRSSVTIDVLGRDMMDRGGRDGHNGPPI